jgi:hypothetical protein
LHKDLKPFENFAALRVDWKQEKNAGFETERNNRIPRICVCNDRMITFWMDAPAIWPGKQCNGKGKKQKAIRETEI